MIKQTAEHDALGEFAPLFAHYNVKHWYGAKNDSWVSHVAVELPRDDTSTEWSEAVTDKEYNNLK